jgi:PAS domain-containing protein
MGYFGTVRDVTEARETEQQLRRSREHLAQAQRVAATGSFELDFHTNRIEWSEETYRIFGVRRTRTLPRRRTRRRQMLEVAEADLERGFVRPQACRKSLAERVDANDRAFRASRWRRGSVASARVHRAHRRGGPRVRTPVTTISVSWLPHREQTSRLRQSGTVVSGPYRCAISAGSGST